MIAEESRGKHRDNKGKLDGNKKKQQLKRNFSLKFRSSPYDSNITTTLKSMSLRHLETQ
jgi:hypothetical protein